MVTYGNNDFLIGNDSDGNCRIRDFLIIGLDRYSQNGQQPVSFRICTRTLVGICNVIEERFRDMQFFYSVLGFVNDSENATRLGYLADGGLTDDDVERMGKRKACSDYTGFLIQIAEKGSLEEILMAVMPCMTGYEYVFGRTLERHPEVLDTYYGPLVRDYTSPFYSECCREWEAYCDKVCGDYPDKARLSSIFREAARHELMFWKMAGGNI